MEYNFTLTEQEAQLMLNALAKRPYEEVANLINKIQHQAITAQQKTTEEKTNPTADKAEG